MIETVFFIAIWPIMYLMITLMEMSMMLQFPHHPRRLPIVNYVEDYHFDMNKYTWDSTKIAAKWPVFLFQWLKGKL